MSTSGAKFDGEELHLRLLHNWMSRLTPEEQYAEHSTCRLCSAGRAAPRSASAAEASSMFCVWDK